jgi:predicted amidophosphoribosyltransferase
VAIPFPPASTAVLQSHGCKAHMGSTRCPGCAQQAAVVCQAHSTAAHEGPGLEKVPVTVHTREPGSQTYALLAAEYRLVAPPHRACYESLPVINI